MKLVLLVAVAAVGGTLAADWVDTKYGEKISKDAGTRKAVRVGMTAGIGALIFGVLNRYA